MPETLWQLQAAADMPIQSVIHALAFEQATLALCSGVLCVAILHWLTASSAAANSQHHLRYTCLSLVGLAESCHEL